MKNVVVTGGAGFVGSHLVERLLKEGCSVTVLDNFSSGKRENLRELSSNPHLSVREVDVSDFDRILPFFRSTDWVFHLASMADIVPSIERPLDYYRSNVTGTISVLEASRLSGVKRFIYTASSSCYGIPKVYPTSETAEIQPQYPYALTKYLGEQVTLHWAQVYQLPCVSLRLFNVYGPRARTSGTYGAVFGVFLAQKLAGKSFTVVGDGTQTRDFTFVTDVVDAFIRAAESDVESEIFNVGSGNAHSINRLVNLLGGDVVNIPKRPGEPDCTFADISKITRLLGWHPRVSFEEGVKIMLQNINQWRNAPLWDEQSIATATRDWFVYLGDVAKKQVKV